MRRLIIPRGIGAAGSVHICLRFLVIWEVFRQTFPKTSPLHRMVSRQATLGTFALISVSTGMLWAVQTYSKSHSVYLAMERSFGFVQAVLILAVLTLARYYHLPVGRNIWGIAVAFGHVQFSVHSDFRSRRYHALFFFPYWYFLSPFSFVAMLGMWTWAVWVYAPNQVAAANEMIDPAGDFGRWAETGDGRYLPFERSCIHDPDLHPGSPRHCSVFRFPEDSRARPCVERAGFFRGVGACSRW